MITLSDEASTFCDLYVQYDERDVASRRAGFAAAETETWLGFVLPCRRTAPFCRLVVSDARLRSTSSHELSVRRTRLATYGDRAFPVAAVT